MMIIGLYVIGLFCLTGLGIALLEELQGKNTVFETEPIDYFKTNAQYMMKLTKGDRS